MKAVALAQPAVVADRQAGDAAAAVVGHQHVPARAIDRQVARARAPATTAGSASVSLPDLRLDGKRADGPALLPGEVADLADRVQQRPAGMQGQERRVGASRRPARPVAACRSPGRGARGRCPCCRRGCRCRCRPTAWPARFGVGFGRDANGGSAHDGTGGKKGRDPEACESHVLLLGDGAGRDSPHLPRPTFGRCPPGGGHHARMVVAQMGTVPFFL